MLVEMVRIKFNSNGSFGVSTIMVNPKHIVYLAEDERANKLMYKHGRLLVRKSGTEPKIRIMGESHNKKLILKCIKIIKISIK